MTQPIPTLKDRDALALSYQVHNDPVVILYRRNLEYEAWRIKCRQHYLSKRGTWVPTDHPETRTHGQIFSYFSKRAAFSHFIHWLNDSGVFPSKNQPPPSAHPYRSKWGGAHAADPIRRSKAKPGQILSLFIDQAIDQAIDQVKTTHPHLTEVYQSLRGDLTRLALNLDKRDKVDAS